MASIVNGSAAVTAAAVSKTITGTFITPYQTYLDPDWTTECVVTGKTATQFVVTFTVPAPAAGGTLGYLVINGSASPTFGPANLTYTQIETRVMNQLRIPTTNTTEQAKVQALINEVYRDIYVKQDWWWLRKRTVVNTIAKVTAGTVNVLNGSTAITFSSVPSGTLPGRVLLIPGDTTDNNAIYRLVNATTLDATFTGTTNTAASFILYQDSYDLPSDCGKIVEVKRYGEVLPLKPVGPSEIGRLKTFDPTDGKPEVWSVFDFSTTGDPTTARQLQVHPYPDKTYRLEIFYKSQLNTELSSTAQPYMPDEFRQIVIYGALARGYPIFLDDLERGKFFQALFNDMLALMVAANMEYATDRPQLVPDDPYRRGKRRRRTATTLGSWFDRLPSSL